MHAWLHSEILLIWLKWDVLPTHAFLLIPDDIPSSSFPGYETREKEALKAYAGQKCMHILPALSFSGIL